MGMMNLTLFLRLLKERCDGNRFLGESAFGVLVFYNKWEDRKVTACVNNADDSNHNSMKRRQA